MFVSAAFSLGYEPVLVLLTRQPAFRSPPEYPITISSHKVVAGVPKTAWQQAGGERESPNPAKTVGDAKCRVGSGVDPLLGGTVVFDHANRLHGCRVKGVPGQDLARCFALLRCEPERVFVVMSQEELDDPVTHPAEAVIKDDSADVG
jgi:hypothetical protein